MTPSSLRRGTAAWRRRQQQSPPRGVRPIERWLDALVEGAWEWDIRAGTVRHNATWCAMLGVGEEMREHDLSAYWRFVHPDDAARVREGLAAALAGAGRLRQDYRMCRSDGTVLWVVDRGTVIERAADGRPLRMVGSLIDVTAERRRLEDQHEAAQRLALALKAGDLGLWDWDYGSGALVVDDRWKEMLGLPPDHPVQHIGDWAPRVHLEDVPRLEAIVREVIEAPGGSDFAVEIRARHADGRWLWILDQGVVAQRDAAGRPLRVIGTHQDITQRKLTARLVEQQRQQLQTIVDTALDAIVTVDGSHRVVVFNRAAERMFGVAADEVRGGSFDRFMPPDMRHGEHDRRMAAFVASGRRSRVITSGGEPTMAVRADGTRFPIEASVSRSGQGDEVLLTAIIRDITEVQRARDALLQKERAEQASAAKSAFLSKVSHELRTPLNAILGFADLMRESEPEAARRQLGYLRQAGQRLLELVNDLLDLGRIEAGRHALVIQPVGLSAALSQVGQLVGAEVLRRGAQLVIELDDDDCAVQADARAFDQILLNLLSNALKFSPVGGTVRLQVSCADPAIVRIAVLDQGPGIPASRFGELFKPYHRLDAGAGSQVPGTGLGLVISHELARQMGGDLAPGTAPGGGACMTLSLPRSPRRVATATPPQVAVGPAAPRLAAQGGRALIVEDDAASAVLLEHLFHVAGAWSVRVATTLSEGLRLLSDERFDLVLTDMNVDGEDGLRIVEAALRHPDRDAITVVAVTADAMPAQLARIRAAGADGCWCKPMDVGQVLDFLRTRHSAWPALLAAGTAAG